VRVGEVPEGRGAGMPCGLTRALPLGNDMVLRILGDVRVGEVRERRGAGIPCGLRSTLPLGDDMVVVCWGQDLGGCDRSYMGRVDFRWFRQAPNIESR
jgi:hypothetical protein